MAYETKEERIENAIRKLLDYGFNAIKWDYSKLTDKEKELVSKEDFELLREKFRPTRHIGDVETDDFSLEVYECTCGFHIGLDISYLEQVDDTFSLQCPACKRNIVVESLEMNLKEDNDDGVL